MSGTSVKAIPRGVEWPARCATCHGALPAEEAVQCPRCATLLHADCRSDLAGCPTFGCGRARVGRAVATPPVATPVSRSPRSPSPADAPAPLAPRRGGLAPALAGLLLGAGLSAVGAAAAWLPARPVPIPEPAPSSLPQASSFHPPAAPPSPAPRDPRAEGLFQPLRPPAPPRHVPGAAEEARALFAPLRR